MRIWFLSAVLALSIGSAFADTVPSPVPADAVVDAEAFLKLPSSDWERVPAPGASSLPAQVTNHVGDQIVLGADVTSETPMSIDLPAGSSPLEDQGWALSVLPSQSLKILVVPLKAGKLTIPALAVKDASGKLLGRTNPWSVDVESAIRPDDPEPKKPADLRPPAGLSFPWWVIVLFSTAGFAVLVALIYWIFRWSKNRKSAAPAPIVAVRSEDELALEAFTRLERAGLLGKGDFKRHCFRISEVLKNYIGARYGFDAPECTTREMLQSLQKAYAAEFNSDKDRLNALGELFSQLDQVKFTDYVPGLQEAQSFLPVAREFVQATRRRPAPVSNPPKLEKT